MWTRVSPSWRNQSSLTERYTRMNKWKLKTLVVKWSHWLENRCMGGGRSSCWKGNTHYYTLLTCYDSTFEFIPSFSFCTFFPLKRGETWNSNQAKGKMRNRSALNSHGLEFLTPSQSRHVLWASSFLARRKLGQLCKIAQSFPQKKFSWVLSL